jgi:DNA-binding NtrC family response regulator
MCKAFIASVVAADGLASVCRQRLASNAWRRQDTAHYLRISRKVLWEKMRKYPIFEEPETRQTEG